MPAIYALMTKAILANSKHPVVVLDWSNADTKKQNHILRASIALEGRSLTLLQMMASTDDYNSPKVHRQFLNGLKHMLPDDCMTDAGYKVPWLKEVRKLGWHLITRVRGNLQLKLPQQEQFINVNALYKKARCNPQDLGSIKLTKATGYQAQAVLVGTGWKLNKCDKKIAKYYSTRMQIEASFRDQKIYTYGLGSNAHGTYKREHLDVLILLAALANWLHYMLAFIDSFRPIPYETGGYYPSTIWGCGNWQHKGTNTHWLLPQKNVQYEEISSLSKQDKLIRLQLNPISIGVDGQVT